jgi:hypothetical protein
MCLAKLCIWNINCMCGAIVGYGMTRFNCIPNPNPKGISKRVQQTLNLVRCCGEPARTHRDVGSFFNAAILAPLCHLSLPDKGRLSNLFCDSKLTTKTHTKCQNKELETVN